MESDISIEKLKDILKDPKFIQWLNNPQLWTTKDIDYAEPRVERVYMQVGNDRVSLHVIHPCDGEPLLHPHGWESAMYVLPIGGLYEQGIGFDVPNYGQAMVCKQIVKGDMYYEMLDPDGIHYVKPLLQPVFTVMLNGPVIWEENVLKADKKLVPLSDERKKEILLTFKNYFE